jgi:hydroxypyruvate isomerase
MPRFAANLSFLYTDLPFPERFAAAARDGFQAVEYLFPYEHEAGMLARLLKENGLQQALFNAPPGNWEAGERGLAALPGREAEFLQGIERALQYAHVLSCPRIHVMSGLHPDIAAPGTTRSGSTSVGSAPIAANTLACWQQNLQKATTLAAQAGVQILIEPINSRDMPGYLLDSLDTAEALLEHNPALKLQLDLYHLQIIRGDLSVLLRRLIPTGRVGHIQIAGVPDRHEPDIGEVNYPHLFRLLDDLGYDGWVGCEYRPARGQSPHATHDGLGWMKAWL